jgi:agmatine deiminase
MSFRAIVHHSKARRAFIKVAAFVALGLASFKRSMASEQVLGAGRIPGEFEPVRAIWLSYAEGHKELTFALIKALLPHVAIKVLTNDPANTIEAKRQLSAQGIDVDKVQFLTDPNSLFFIRDVAVFVSSSKAGEEKPLGIIKFRWQYYGLPGWCKRRYGNRTDQFNKCVGQALATTNEFAIAVARHAGIQSIPSDLIIEGGAIEVNGEGLIIANQRLSLQRNPGRSVAALEREYLALPGIRKVIWVPDGLAEDPQLRSTIVGPYVGWGTGGHTDEFVRFADAKTVLLAWPNDDEAKSHPVARLNRGRMQRNFEVLSRAIGTDGQKLKVIKVPMPKIIERPVFLSATADRAYSEGWTADYFPASERRREGDRVIQVASASYMNFVIANGVVVVPSYVKHGTPPTTEMRVQNIFQDVFPKRDIVFVDAISTNWVGGGPHCATLHEPM